MLKIDMLEKVLRSLTGLLTDSWPWYLVLCLVSAVTWCAGMEMTSRTKETSLIGSSELSKRLRRGSLVERMSGSKRTDNPLTDDLQKLHDDLTASKNGATGTITDASDE